MGVPAALTYALEHSTASTMEREVELFTAAGLTAEIQAPGLPFVTAGAVRLADQAQFDPVPFLHDMATEIADRGGRCASRSGSRGSATAPRVSGSTPTTAPSPLGGRWWPPDCLFLDRGLFFARAEPKSSYVVACEVESMPPAGMYLAHDGPTRSLRTAPSPRR